MAGKLSIPALERALKATRDKLTKLKASRDKMEKELAKLNAEIAGLEGDGTSKAPAKAKPAATRRASRANKGEGLDVLVPKALMESDRPLRMGELADACKALGYKTASKNFTNVVAQYVYRDTNVVRVGRGLYTLKDKAAAPAAPAAEEKPAAEAKPAAPAKKKAARKTAKKKAAKKKA